MKITLDITTHVSLRQSHGIRLPLVWGWREPLILLPCDHPNWGDDELESVLMHELAHIKRRDVIANLLRQLALIIYWFHPLMIGLAKRQGLVREMACDDHVILAGQDSRRYAAHLANLVVGVDVRPEPELAAGLGSVSPLRQRLMGILDRGRNRSMVSSTDVVYSGTTMLAVGMMLASLGFKAAAEFHADRIVAETSAADPKQVVFSMWDDVFAPLIESPRESASPENPDELLDSDESNGGQLTLAEQYVNRDTTGEPTQIDFADPGAALLPMPKADTGSLSAHGNHTLTTKATFQVFEEHPVAHHLTVPHFERTMPPKVPVVIKESAPGGWFTRIQPLPSMGSPFKLPDTSNSIRGILANGPLIDVAASELITISSFGEAYGVTVRAGEDATAISAFTPATFLANDVFISGDRIVSAASDMPFGMVWDSSPFNEHISRAIFADALIPADELPNGAAISVGSITGSEVSDFYSVSAIFHQFDSAVPDAAASNLGTELELIQLGDDSLSLAAMNSLVPADSTLTESDALNQIIDIENLTIDAKWNRLITEARMDVSESMPERAFSLSTFPNNQPIKKSNLVPFSDDGENNESILPLKDSTMFEVSHGQVSRPDRTVPSDHIHSQPIVLRDELGQVHIGMKCFVPWEIPSDAMVPQQSNDLQNWADIAADDLLWMRQPHDQDNDEILFYLQAPMTSADSKFLRLQIHPTAVVGNESFPEK